MLRPASKGRSMNRLQKRTPFGFTLLNFVLRPFMKKLTSKDLFVQYIFTQQSFRPVITMRATERNSICTPKSDICSIFKSGDSLKFSPALQICHRYPKQQRKESIMRGSTIELSTSGSVTRRTKYEQ